MKERISNEQIQKYKVHEVYQALKDYPDNIRRYEFLINDLDQAYNITPQYGLESAMPRAKGDIRDMVYKEYSRRIRVLREKQKVVIQIELIQSFCDSESYEQLSKRDKIVLDFYLKGASQREIARKEAITQPAVQKRLRKIAVCVANTF